MKGMEDVEPGEEERRENRRSQRLRRKLPQSLGCPMEVRKRMLERLKGDQEI